MIQIPFTKPDRYIKCPCCGVHEFPVSHLKVGVQTSWYCDACGKRFRLRVLVDGIELEPSANGECKAYRLVTLRSDGPVTLLVKGFSLMPDDDEIEHARYYYDEYTCPTNFLGNVVEVVDANGNKDPHGVFRFVSMEPWPEPNEPARDIGGDFEKGEGAGQ